MHLSIVISDYIQLVHVFFLVTIISCIICVFVSLKEYILWKFFGFAHLFREHESDLFTSINLLSSIQRWFAASHRVKSWALLVPAALCYGQFPWSPQGVWWKPPPSISCLPMVASLSLLVAYLDWHIWVIRLSVCLELPKHKGLVEFI